MLHFCDRVMSYISCYVMHMYIIGIAAYSIHVGTLNVICLALMGATYLYGCKLARQSITPFHVLNDKQYGTLHNKITNKL